MRQMCDRLLVHYNWLCKHAVAEDRLCYNITVKHHMLWHICDMSRFLNPTVVWTYELEDVRRHCDHVCQGKHAWYSLAISGHKGAAELAVGPSVALMQTVEKQ